jgi:hypothetical protein
LVGKGCTTELGKKTGLNACEEKTMAELVGHRCGMGGTASTTANKRVEVSGTKLEEGADQVLSLRYQVVAEEPPGKTIVL